MLSDLFVSFFLICASGEPCVAGVSPFLQLVQDVFGAHLLPRPLQCIDVPLMPPGVGKHKCVKAPHTVWHRPHAACILLVLI